MSLVTHMNCRKGCGACCIAPSIVQPFYGMPQGKPAGVVCVHLGPEYRCALFGDNRRPALCEAFQAEPEWCGVNRQEAMKNIQQLEITSYPG
jgi:Fe-S-cluster containining protein